MPVVWKRNPCRVFNRCKTWNWCKILPKLKMWKFQVEYMEMLNRMWVNLESKKNQKKELNVRTTFMPFPPPPPVRVLKRSGIFCLFTNPLRFGPFCLQPQLPCSETYLVCSVSKPLFLAKFILIRLGHVPHPCFGLRMVLLQTARD